MDAQIFKCPQCGKSLKAEVKPGDNVECSECGNVFPFQSTVFKDQTKCPYCGEEFEARENSWGDVKCQNCKKTLPLRDGDLSTSETGNTRTASGIQRLSPSSGFATLNTFGSIISVVGWIYMAVAIIAGIVIIAETEEIGGVVVIILGIIAGIMIIATGQVFTCFVSMERGIQDIKQEIRNLNKG